MWSAIATRLGGKRVVRRRFWRRRRGEQKNAWLELVAETLVEESAVLIQANAEDLANAALAGLNRAAMDRLELTEARLQAVAQGVRQVAALPEPIGRVLDSNIRPNGLQILKVGVPLGVIFFIYESRPNVTVDAAALAVKSGNAMFCAAGTRR